MKCIGSTFFAMVYFQLQLFGGIACRSPLGLINFNRSDLVRMGIVFTHASINFVSSIADFWGAFGCIAICFLSKFGEYNSMTNGLIRVMPVF